jgi:hypothetical protein
MFMSRGNRMPPSTPRYGEPAKAGLEMAIAAAHRRIFFIVIPLKLL